MLIWSSLARLWVSWFSFCPPHILESYHLYCPGGKTRSRKRKTSLGTQTQRHCPPNLWFGLSEAREDILGRALEPYRKVESGQVGLDSIPGTQLLCAWRPASYRCPVPLPALWQHNVTHCTLAVLTLPPKVNRKFPEHLEVLGTCSITLSSLSSVFQHPISWRWASSNPWGEPTRRPEAMTWS